MNPIQSVASHLLDLLFPRRCPVCGRIVVPRGRLICPGCMNRLSWVKQPVCKSCGKELSVDTVEYCFDCARRPRSFVYGRGGSFEDMTTPEAVQGMQDFIDIYTKGYVPPTATSDGFNEIIANFKSGLTAMTIHHTGSSADMEATFGDDVSAFPFPAGKGQWTSMGDTETVIFESCQNKEAAFEWVSYLAAGEGQKMWCEGTGNVPVSKTVQAGDFFQSNRFMKASIDGQSYAGIAEISTSH